MPLAEYELVSLLWNLFEWKGVKWKMNINLMNVNVIIKYVMQRMWTHRMRPRIFENRIKYFVASCKLNECYLESKLSYHLNACPYLLCFMIHFFFFVHHHTIWIVVFCFSRAERGEIFKYEIRINISFRFGFFGKFNL